MTIKIRRVHDASVVLARSATETLPEYGQTHIGSSIPIILPRLRPIGLVVRDQHDTPIEAGSQPRDDVIRLGVGTGREGARRAREDVRGARSLELPAAAEVQHPIHVYFAIGVAERRLRVHGQRRAGVVVEDFVHVVGPVCLEPGWVEQDAGVWAQDPE